GCDQSYTVKPGDNLFRIALNHGVKLQELRDANNLNGTNSIRSGMNLCIPK
ncbi:MAG: LysM peptidoglycan-binding domain-containing protein, partial [Anaerolineales bacterium]|nr:LysM peptidoglycan-binding domain-containing protein [Anaerolineales bacterium]